LAVNSHQAPRRTDRLSLQLASWTNGLMPEATMLGSFRAIKSGLVVLATSAMLAVTPTLSHAATGSVRITISRTGFIFGGGSGTLHFEGKRYALRVGGVSVGPLGAPSVDLVGRAYHMRTAASIHGRYSAVVADAASPGGARLVRLQNWQGVVLKLRGRRGVKPSVDLSGLEISLRQ
jgi:hypothetical protein